MASSTRPRTQPVAECSRVLPWWQATETYTSSVTFMKQLTIVAMSAITYLLDVCPKNNYVIDTFGGLQIRVLKRKCDDELAQFLLSALTRTFEALDKKYLRQVALCFYEEENLVEFYQFEYEYGAGAEASVIVRSAARGRAETSVTLNAVGDRINQLLQACMVMVSNTQLPQKYNVTLRHSYNADAPQGYKVPGSSVARTLSANEAAAWAERLRLGSVSTRFHRLQLHMRHRATQDNTLEASETTTVSLSGRSASSSCAAATGEAGAPLAAPPRAPRSKRHAVVRCACGCRDMLAHMLLCGWCRSMQHAVCYGLHPAAPPYQPPAHCCVPCAERSAGLCAERGAGLIRAPHRTIIKSYAKFRRALGWVWSRAAGGPARVSAAALSAGLAISVRTASQFMRVLSLNGIIAQDPPDDTETEVDVVPSLLEVALAHYFSASPCPSPAPGQHAQAQGGSEAMSQSQEGPSMANDVCLAEEDCAWSAPQAEENCARPASLPEENSAWIFPQAEENCARPASLPEEDSAWIFPQAEENCARPASLPEEDSAWPAPLAAAPPPPLPSPPAPRKRKQPARAYRAKRMMKKADQDK